MRSFRLTRGQFVFFLVLLCVKISFGQGSKVPVQGKVTDANGNPLVGVSVLIDGTTSGTITDVNGAFNLETEKGTVLVF